jgi:RHS repeat-associated protein
MTLAMNSGLLEGARASFWPRKVAVAERWNAITPKIRCQIFLRQHNAPNRIVSKADAIGTSTFGYNNRNERTKHTRTDNSCVNFGYDNLGQLTSALGYLSGGSPITNEQLGYGYDGGWNMTQRTVNGSPTSYTVNDRNQVTAISGLGSATFDANGPETYTYVYDDENRLVEMRTDTGYTPDASRWRSTWVYDGLGRARRRKDFTWYPGSPGGWYNLGETRFLYDGRRVIQERNSGNTPTVSYTRGSDLSGSLEGAGGIGGLLGRSHGYSGGNWSTHNHYHADGGGNITYLVNSSQGLAASYRYDPYGRVIGWSGSLTNANVYRFSSKEIHAKSGMYGYGFRFYDPTLQRWLNRDPIFEAGGINLYGFVFNRPLNGIDPWGLDEFDDICGDFLRERRKNMQEGAELFHTVKNEVGKELAMSAVPVGRLARLGGAGKRTVANVAAQLGRWPRHHVIPDAILKRLPADVRKAVQGRRGDPNRWPIPPELHDKIHDHNRGFRGGPYNKFFDDKLKALGDKKPTVDDLLKWKEEAVDLFGLRPYCPQ